ncbi:MFS transporter [Streptomyces caeni]|uniref:MFS transporter n=1 Tax=Streptomyces caeni TaxID=2307231 RepID=A0ABW4IVA2_9ACTN
MAGKWIGVPSATTRRLPSSLVVRADPAKVAECMKFLSSYRQLFSLPKFGSSLFAGVAGKLKLGISSVALLLEVAHHRGFKQAAIVVSVSALAGVTAPLRGRLMDRYGYALVMCPSLVAYLGALTVLVLNESAHGPFATTVVCAFVASTSIPPIQIVTRLMWGAMTTGRLRTTVLSLDAVLTDVGYIVGPTVAAFLVAAVAPWAGLAASALLTTSATLLLLSRKLPHQRGQPRSAERHWLGSLRNRALRTLMVAVVCFFMAVRAIELALPAWAQQHKSPLMGGVLLSCMSVGSMAGGLILGALPTRRSARATFPVTLAVLCLGTSLVAAASFVWTAVLIVATAFMGIAVGPSFVALYATAGDLAPANMAAETQSWIGSSVSLGGAAGAAVSGVVIQAWGPGALLVLAAASSAAASGLACGAVRAGPVTSEQVRESIPIAP